MKNELLPCCCEYDISDIICNPLWYAPLLPVPDGSLNSDRWLVCGEGCRLGIARRLDRGLARRYQILESSRTPQSHGLYPRFFIRQYILIAAADKHNVRLPECYIGANNTLYWEILCASSVCSTEAERKTRYWARSREAKYLVQSPTMSKNI